jgi:hypothetical protein
MLGMRVRLISLKDTEHTDHTDDADKRTISEFSELNDYLRWINKIESVFIRVICVFRVFYDISLHMPAGA